MTRETPAPGAADGGGRAVERDEGGCGARPGVGGREPDDLVRIPGAVAGVAAVQHDERVAPGRRDAAEQPRRLLVGAVPAVRRATAAAHQRLVAPVRLARPE